MDTIATLLGITGLVVMTAGFAAANDNSLRRINAAGLTIWSAHFAMLGYFAIALSMLAGLVLLITRIRQRHDLLGPFIAIAATILAATSLGWLAGVIGIEAPLSMLVTLLMSGGAVMFSGHAVSASLALGLGLNICVAFLAGSWPAVATNTINLAALMIRSVRMLRAGRVAV